MVESLYYLLLNLVI